MIRKQNELVQFLNIGTIFELEEHELEADEEVAGEFDDEEYEAMETEEALNASDSELDVKGIEIIEEIEECEVTDEDVVETLMDENLENPKSPEMFFEITDDKNSKFKVPRQEEVKYEDVNPQLVLTPNFLKAREALKNLPNETYEASKAADFVEATVIENDEEKRVFICSDSKCKAFFSSKDEVRLHLNDHVRFDPSPIQCDLCSLTFDSRHSHDKHMNNFHEGSQFICQVCGKALKSRVQWRSHLRNHDQTLKHKCNFEGCNKAFRVKHHLINHLRTHTKESPFKCTFEGCSASFRQKHALTIHLRKHNQVYINCEHCKSPFVTQFQLNKHLEKCNGVFKPLVSRATPKNKTDRVPSEVYKCSIDECDESFKVKISLEKHLIKAHEIEVTSSFCVLCCQNFENQQALKSHTRDHLPFSCVLCSVNFKNEENLNNHMMKSHDKDEVRLHNCDHCSASFKRAEHLRTHVAYKHNENRPYMCDTCPYSSRTRSDLNSHMKSHLKEKNVVFCATCALGFENKFVFEKHIRNCK